MAESEPADADDATHRERFLEGVEKHMEKHREIYEKLARE
jgi:hypothetical protein